MTAAPIKQLRSASRDNADDDVNSDTTLEEADEEGALWTVEDVLAEVPAEPGLHTRHFLILWTGFDLHDSTWEPEKHLEPATIRSWEEVKDAIERGERERFDVADWWNARSEHLHAKLDRARRRDKKKLARGRPLTGNAAILEEQLRDHLATEAAYYGIEASELHLESSDSDVNETVLPPPESIDLTTSPPRVQEPVRPQTEPRKPAKAQHNAPSPTKKNRKGSASTQTTAASTSVGKQRRQSLQQKAGGRNAVLPPTTSSATSGVVQSSREMQPTAPKQNLKAKRTGGAAGMQGAGANIFTSGKVARKRRNLAESMKDPTKENKLFSKHRLARIAYKQSRDKEDLPPATVSSKLFDISKGPTKDPTKSTERAGQTTKTPQQRPSTLVKRRTTDDGSKSAGDPLPPMEKKRKKSVTFCDTPEVQSPPPILESSPRSEPMNLDEVDEPGLFVEGGTRSLTDVKLERHDINPSFTSLTIDDNLQFEPSRTMKKIVDFGSGGTRKLEVSLDGIPDSPNEPWLADFMGNEEINFTHTCVAKNLSYQLDNIAGEKIGSGHIRSCTTPEALENVATRLRLGSFGAVCFRDGYLVVVYPTRCNDWRLDVFDTEATSPSDADLGYMLFTRGSDGNPPPDQPPAPEQPADDSLGDRGMVWHRLLGFDYKSLLPKACVQGEPGKGGHAFFLMFPPSREAQMDALCLYLRSCDRQCVIYTNREEGSWDLVLNGTGCCTIIIHEAATWALRTLKEVHRLMPVGDSRASFWRVTEAMTAYSGIPLGESERWAPPGKIGTHRLFPSGKIILLTPSFLVTQPHRAAQFLMWYSENIARCRHRRTNKIVVAHDVCDYLRAIADQMWMGRKGSAGSNPDLNRTVEASVSRDNCDATETAWSVLRELFEVSRGSGDWDEDTSPIVCAPAGIAPGDEQSLVNWFGWWSIMNLEVYRCFIVLGTDDADMGNGVGATVATSLPTYHPVTISDPDGRTAGSEEATASYAELKFPCHHLPNDNPNSMVSFIESLNKNYITPKSPTVFYKFPVGFSNNESRANAPDFHPRLESFQTWFSYLRPFSWLPVGELKKGGGSKIVYGGLFYTADDDPDGSNRGWREGQVRRHPWLAFYRPALPHTLSRKKFDGNYELIIWDWTTPSKFPGGDRPTEDKLFPEQRQLIGFVEQNTAVKNRGSQLKNVWLGGPTFATPNAHPMDLTLDFLETVMEDTKTALPSADYQLHNANYRKVVPQPPAQDVPALEREGTDEDVVYSDIFHPPRGNGSFQPSGCKNLLFEQARQALRSGNVARDGTFPYTFEPTMKWYGQQQREGRGFEHILVGPWKAGFDVLRIGKEGKDGMNSRSPTSLTEEEGLWKTVVPSKVSPVPGRK